MKKIVIFTSGGGRGHISVTDALTQQLGDTYEIQSDLIFDDVLHKIDLSYYLTGGAKTGEGWYNYFIQRKWYRLINLMYKAGSWYFQARRHKIVRLISEYLDTHKPDLVISVTPLINNQIMQATQQRDVPFLLIPTDLDARTFLVNIQDPTYKKFNLALPFDDCKLKALITSANVPVEQTTITGFPLRKSFSKKYDLTIVRAQYTVPDKKPVILVLMGGVGSAATVMYARNLAQVTQTAHIIFCIGKSEHLRAEIESISWPAHLSFSVIGFTENIAELISIADVFITKSGSVSFAEGIYMEAPMLLDATTDVLTWEQFNHDFVVRHGIGDVIKSENSIAPLVTHWLANSHKRMQIKQNLYKLEKKNGCREVQQLITKILS